MAADPAQLGLVVALDQTEDGLGNAYGHSRTFAALVHIAQLVQQEGHEWPGTQHPPTYERKPEVKQVGPADKRVVQVHDGDRGFPSRSFTHESP
jgi:hypothetical protein